MAHFEVILAELQKILAFGLKKSAQNVLGAPPHLCCALVCVAIHYHYWRPGQLDQTELTAGIYRLDY